MGFFSSIKNLFHKDSPAPQEQGAVSAPPRAEAENAPASSDAAGFFADSDPELALALRQAEPKLSAWLAVILAGVDGAGDLLWKRLAFLFASLEAPQAEAQAFIDTFRRWLTSMGYQRLDDFRSELQYRLALALDVEDEEDERNRLVQKISVGLAKTREQVGRGLNVLFSSGRRMDEAFWEELEEVLITADVGFDTAHKLTTAVRRKAEAKGLGDPAELKELLREEILALFAPVKRIAAVNPPEVVLMIGVNGVGKTTTIAKLAHREVSRGKKVLLAAGDTFRAAACEQLHIWAERTGAEFYAKSAGADPAAVAFEALDRALELGCDTVFIDTAGRLHTKTNLMEELAKIRRVLGKRHPGAPHRTIMIMDAGTGQNGLSQIKLFTQGCGIDELILTKLDGTAKGGIAAACAAQFGIPISFVGLGEKMEDLRPFDPKAFVAALLD